jgi:hypothetical protein
MNFNQKAAYTKPPEIVYLSMKDLANFDDDL